MRIIAILSLILAGTFMGTAQIEHPKISPISEVYQKVGLTDIRVRYSRPGVKNRTIIGELVPYHKVWRTGANKCTTITTSKGIVFAGEILPIGTYALYTIPHKEYWQVIISKDTSAWQGSQEHKKAYEVFRVKIEPEVLKDFQETFLITFDDLEHSGANLVLQWENTRIQIPISVGTHALMMEEINNKIEKNPGAETFYQAARYLQEQNIEHQWALELLDKAEQSEGKKYYIHRVRALLLAAQENYKQAIYEAQRSLILAVDLQKEDYIWKNQNSIDLWRSKL